MRVCECAKISQITIEFIIDSGCALDIYLNLRKVYALEFESVVQCPKGGVELNSTRAVG